MVHEIYSTKNDVIMDMPLINMGGKNVLIPTFCYGVRKLLSNLMCFLKTDFSRLKGLYQVMG